MLQLSLIFSHYLVKLFTLRLQTGSDSNARLGIAANAFWGGRFEHSFFDVRVFNPSALLNHPFKPITAIRGRRGISISNVCMKLSMHGHFTPLVFTTTGGMADGVDHVYANLLSEKLDLSYGEVMGGPDVS